MSAEDNRLIYNIALKRFKERKVEISDAIKTLFPFLEILRDRGFITNEKYKESKNSCENLSPVPRVVYDVLNELEEKFDLSVLRILFSNVIMKKYPDLKGIYEGFRDVMPKDMCHQVSNEEERAENRNTQLSLKQGTVANSYLCLPWLFPDPPNTKGTAPPDNRLPHYLCEREEISAVAISTTNDSGPLQIEQANEQCAQESEPAEINSDDTEEFSDGAEPPEASTAGLKRKPESSNLRKSPTSEKKLCTREESHEGSSGASANKRLPGAMTPAVRSHEGSSEFSAEQNPPGAETPAVTSGANEQGPMDLGTTPTLQKANRRRCERSKKHEEENVDFCSEILPVTCGKLKGMLYKNKLQQGSTVKCIKTEDGTWFTPSEFEVAAGYQKSIYWKNILCCGGKTLEWLLKGEKLFIPPRSYNRNEEVEIKAELPEGRERGQVVLLNVHSNPNVCEVCEDGENLLCCDTCSRFFHGYCHFPREETERSPWSCTFCRIKESSGGQPCVSESEVLARWMGPEEQLKCEFLLLAIFCHSDNSCFEKVPHDNYGLETLECIKNLMMLNEVGKTLSVRGYPKVEQFMRDMRLIFQHHRAFDKCEGLFSLGMRLEAEFEKNFKKVFAIQEIKQEHSEITIKLENNA